MTQVPQAQGLARTLFGAGLIATVVELAWYGSDDITHALTYAGRISGFVCLAAALAVIAAFGAFLDCLRHRPARYSGGVVLAGVLISLFFNLLLLALQIDGGGYTHFLLFWALLIPWSCWALWRLHRLGVWGSLPHPRGFAAGVVVSVVVAFGSFSYNHVYQPYKFPALVSTAVEFRPATVADGVLSLPVVLRTRNRGQVALYVAGSLFQVNGRHGDTRKEPRTADELRGDVEEEQWDLLRHTEVGAPAVDVLAQGRYILSGRLLQPGEESLSQKVVQIPLDAPYDVIAANAVVVTLRADRATLLTDLHRSTETSWTVPEWKKHPRDPDWVASHRFRWPSVQYRSPVAHSNALLEHSRPTRELTVWWVLKPPTGESLWAPYLEYLIAPEGEDRAPPSPAARRRMTERYGLSATPSGAFIAPLAALVQQARAAD
ncbi:hypothetical protein [Streptomyces sp. NPDC014894]|uniref:hypothetical protein n=1 Tax=Streptomyces sp. NPDC014894 TaxID=3364931 RepID=UPI0036F6F1B8